MKKLIIIGLFFVSLSCFSQTTKDSLITLYDGNHRILEPSIHVNDLLFKMEEHKQHVYYIQETKEDGQTVECKYVRREEFFDKITF